MDYYENEFEYIKSNLWNTQKNDPRYLLVFINVLSGQGLAIDVFLKAARPYLTFCKIKFDVIAVTSPSAGLPLSPRDLQNAVGCESLSVLSGRISDYIQSMESTDIEKYDGFVVVGGDGTLGELATGCMLYSQQQKDEPFKYNCISADSEIQPFSKPIGIIPAGSTDAIACTLYGTRDPHVAAICIALGNLTYMDVQAVFADGYFTKVSLATVSCGVLTDLLIGIKAFSRYGKLKAVFAFIQAMYNFTPQNIAVEYRPRDDLTNTAHAIVPCKFMCSDCEEWLKTSRSALKNSALTSESKWRWAVGDLGPIAAFNSYSNPTRLPFALKKGVAPLCHMNDGTSQIFVIPHGGGRCRLLCNFAASVLGCIGAVYFRQNPFITVTAIRSCCEFRVTAKNSVSTEEVEQGILPSMSWNVDGEVIRANCVHSVVHSKILRFFGTGGPLPSPGPFSILFYLRIVKLCLPFLILRSSLSMRKGRWHAPCLKQSFGRSLSFWICALILLLLIFMFYYYYHFLLL